MALKGDRKHIDSRIDMFMNHVATRGGIVCALTAGSGTALDQSVQAVHYDSSPSGATPIGVLMGDMVNLDLTRQHENWHKEEVQKGGKVTIWEKCEVTTNVIVSGDTVTVGQPAYLATQGQVTNTNTGAIASPRIGTFMSTKDENGYAKLAVNLPGN